MYMTTSQTWMKVARIQFSRMENAMLFDDIRVSIEIVEWPGSDAIRQLFQQGSSHHWP
jgi:hypothetical protein